MKRLYEFGWLVFVVLVAAGPALPTIEWDSRTLRLIERDADYGRMARLGDGSIGCVFDRGGRMYFRRSSDEGVTFSPAVLVAEDGECWLTNANLLCLRDGTLIYFWNERPWAAMEKGGKRGESKRPFLIRMARSNDVGKTWSVPTTVYAGGTKFGDGCWEPAGVQLPGGEVQVYFANESPYRTSDEQEISLMRSGDGGVNWSKAECVGFRAKHRDGMPAPLLLADGTVAVAIEDNGLAGGRFKISILISGDDWKTGPVGGDSLNRHAALASPLPAETYAGAPQLVRLSGGFTLLSCQESADGSLRHCRMAVYVGDARAGNFAHRTEPLPVVEGGNQMWNSLFVKGPDVVTAILGTTVDQVRGIYAIDGRVIFPR